MLAVSLSENEVKDYISDKISLAAINGSKRTVLAGEDKDIDEISNILTAQSIQNKNFTLHTPSIHI